MKQGGRMIERRVFLISAIVLAFILAAIMGVAGAWILIEKRNKDSDFASLGLAPAPSPVKVKQIPTSRRAGIFEFESTPREVARWILSSPTLHVYAKFRREDELEALIVALLENESEAMLINPTLGALLREKDRTYYFDIYVARGQSQGMVIVEIEVRVIP